MNKDLAMQLWNNKSYFSKGKRGLIYVSKFEGDKFVIKVKNPESTANNTIRNEYESNLLLNSFNIGPEVFYYDSELDFVIREFVEGEKFFDWIINVKDKKIIKKFFIELLNQCQRMDDAMINKLEMNHPHKDLLVKDNMPIIIDFERCKKTLKPKNVTQVCQFIISTNIENHLKKIDLILDKKKILLLAEKYKKESNEINKKKFFEKIKKEIK